MDRDRQRTYWALDQAGRRSPEHPAVRALFEPRARYLASLLPDPSAGSVVDVGCGNGYLTWWLERRFGRVVGVDFSRQMLEKNPCREKVLGSATELPLADGSVDIAVESHLLHHLVESDRSEAVQEMARVARRAVVLYEPNRNNPLMFAFGALKPEERMSLQFSRRYLGGLLHEAGFLEQSLRVEGLIVPNRAPACWAAISRQLEDTLLHKVGFYCRATARHGSPPAKILGAKAKADR